MADNDELDRIIAKTRAAHQEAWKGFVATGTQFIQAKRELTPEDFIALCQRVLNTDGVDYYSPTLVIAVMDFAKHPSNEGYDQVLEEIHARLRKH